MRIPDLTALSTPDLLALHDRVSGAGDGAADSQPPADAPPAFPDLITPAVAPAPAVGFRERLAAGLAQQPGYQPQPFEGGASRFGRGLLAGAERGYSGGTLLGMKNQQAAAEAKTAANKTAADRANALRMEAWKARLTDYYGERKDARGKVRVTPKDAEDTGLPEGTDVTPEALAKARGDRLAGMRADRAQREMARHNRAMEAKPTGGGLASNAGSMTDAGIEYAAQYLNDTGEMLPLGMGNGAARAAIIGRAAQMRAESGTGGTLAESKSGFAANKASLVKLRGMVDAVSAFENTALANSGVLLDAMKRIPDTGSPFLNAPIRALAGKLGGSAEMASYEAARQIVLPEFAKLLSNPNLTGVLTDDARRELGHVLAGDATLNQMRSLIDTLTRDAANRKRFYLQQMGEIQGRINPGATTAEDDEFARYRRKPTGRP